MQRQQQKTRNIFHTLANPLNPSFHPRFKTYTHPKLDHDAIYVFDMKRQQEEKFELFQTVVSNVSTRSLQKFSKK